MKLVVALTIFLTFVTSCTPERVEDFGICTTLFAQVYVHVRQNGQPAQLDSTYVIKKSNGQKIVHPKTTYPPGNYIVLNDNYMGLTPDTFTIHGYLGGSKVLQEAYYIDRDKCHIFGVSGKDTVIIQ